MNRAVRIMRHLSPHSTSSMCSKEDELLDRLRHGDQTVIRMLWELWYSEQGAGSKEHMLDGINMIEKMELNVAEALFSQLCKEHPMWAEAYNKLATVHFLSGELDKSKRSILKALELKPRHFGALSGLVQVSLGLKDTDGTMEALKRLFAVHPAGARRLLQAIFESTGEGKGQEALRAAPDSVQVFDRSDDVN